MIFEKRHAKVILEFSDQIKLKTNGTMNVSRNEDDSTGLFASVHPN